ncbi:uncharacterized protein DSM5745_04355 [Aspergillus mulundensis]|uniref:Uncharacterized protein n=1 Tax=Aspergillus mulundensis TaxID=1810919 RepID=A0A3D8SCF8_9EURO|nr:hypothetical protein DSM5745_04355 [Aspergillus mulundensis]RDW84029.1 hypothetical protein DSM5745_04355 [Aspergillus mulundensis]
MHILRLVNQAFYHSANRHFYRHRNVVLAFNSDRNSSSDIIDQPTHSFSQSANARYVKTIAISATGLHISNDPCLLALSPTNKNTEDHWRKVTSEALFGALQEASSMGIRIRTLTLSFELDNQHLNNLWNPAYPPANPEDPDGSDETPTLDTSGDSHGYLESTPHPTAEGGLLQALQSGGTLQSLTLDSIPPHPHPQHDLTRDTVAFARSGSLRLIPCSAPLRHLRIENTTVPAAALLAIRSSSASLGTVSVCFVRAVNGTWRQICKRAIRHCVHLTDLTVKGCRISGPRSAWFWAQRVVDEDAVDRCMDRVRLRRRDCCVGDVIVMDRQA